MKHLVAAAGYSAAGAKRLWAETAFRHEVFGAVCVVVLLAMIGASAVEMAIAVVLLLVLFAVEALNTAIEVLVDHLSPDWAQFAKDAKDLGSFAVFCLLAANAAFLLAVIVTRVG